MLRESNIESEHILLQQDHNISRSTDPVMVICNSGKSCVSLLVR